MPQNYFVYYAEANIVCIILISIMLFHDLRKVSRQEKQILFDYAVTAHVAYFISDTFWAAVIAGVLPRTRWLVLAVNLSNYILLSSIAFFWFFFAVEAVGMPLWRNRWKDRRRMNLIRLPMLGMLAVFLVAYAVDPAFWINSAGELNAAYYPLMVAAPIIYILMSLYCALSQARRTENLADRWLYILIGVYPLSMAVFGLIQLRFPYIPLFCFGLTIMMLFFYVQILEDRISLDPMTGLNNRGQLLRYVSQEANLRREGKQTYVVMIDANYFKQINDTYGHAEGDEAILIIAGALKEAAGSMANAPFLGRYGGDEFILVVHVFDETELFDLAEEIRRRLASACREKPYTLTLGMGWSELTGQDDTFQACLKRADRRLYLDKEQQKQSAAGRTS